MAKKDKKNEILEEEITLEEEFEGEDELTPKQRKKFEKAVAKSAELEKEIEALKDKIYAEPDQKAKNKLRKQRDDLIAQYEGIATSKDGMTVPMSRKAKKAVTAVIAIVVIIALLCAYVSFGVVKKGLLSYFGVPQSNVAAAYVVDPQGEKHPIKVSTYNYYYALTYQNLQNQKSQYSQYGFDDETLKSLHLDIDFDKKLSKQTTTNDDGETITYAEYVQDLVLDSIKSTYTYYFEAVKANDGKEPEVSEDDLNDIQDTLDNYTSTAKQYNYTLDGYLKLAMGKGVNEKVFRRESEIAYISDDYKSKYTDELKAKGYTDEEYDKYKEDNMDDLVAVNIKLFECSTEGDAKKFVKELKADGSNFATLASKYSDNDWDKEAYKNADESTYNDLTRPTLQSLTAYSIAAADEHTHEDGEEHSDDEETTYSGIDKIFAAKAGDIIQQSTSVVYVTKASHLCETKVVNVRHILIKPEVDDESAKDAIKNATKKQWSDAYAKAEDILKQWKDGDATAESFGELAKENTADSNGDDGGLYENLVPNKMVPTFNAWCFDSSRKAGDTAIVKTEYGYHIMYFESTGNMPTWKYTAQQALATDDSDTTQKELEASYTIRVNWLGSRFMEVDTDIDN